MKTEDITLLEFMKKIKANYYSYYPRNNENYDCHLDISLKSWIGPNMPKEKYEKFKTNLDNSIQKYLPEAYKLIKYDLQYDVYKGMSGRAINLYNNTEVERRLETSKGYCREIRLHLYLKKN